MIASILAAASIVQVQQVEMRVTYPNGKSGIARVTRKARPEGGWVSMMAIELESDSKKIKVRAESIISPNFEPIRKTLETLDAKGKRLSYVVADFDVKGAQVITENGPNREVKRFDLEQKWPRKDPTVAWFLGELPKSGGKSTFMTFEMSPPNWVQKSATYLGNKMVRIGNQTIKGYQLSLDGEPVLLDEHGLPIRLESQGVIFERVAR